MEKQEPEDIRTMKAIFGEEEKDLKLIREEIKQGAELLSGILQSHRTLWELVPKATTKLREEQARVEEARAYGTLLQEYQKLLADAVEV